MTRVSRRGIRKRADVSQLTPEQERQLTDGVCYFDPMTDAEFHEAWKVHRERIMQEWITRHPGTRPFAWWVLEGVPKHGARRIIAKGWRDEYSPRWETRGILHTHADPPIQETELAYLKRHKLLEACEK